MKFSTEIGALAGSSSSTIVPFDVSSETKTGPFAAGAAWAGAASAGFCSCGACIASAAVAAREARREATIRVGVDMGGSSAGPGIVG